MKYVLVNNEAQEFGTFDSVEQVTDGYNCDDTISYESITGPIVEVKEVPDDYLTPAQQEQQAQMNKQIAVQLLNQTDWTTIADVGNPQMSNPYLANQAAFIQYRNEVRQYAVYPTPGTIDWPVIPTEEWVKV